MKEIPVVKAVREIYDTNGKIFYTEFIKRSTGEVRKMWARLGVTKDLNGGSKPYNDKEKGLITVYDMAKKDYRSIPKENMLRLTVNHKKYKVKY